MFIRDKSEGSVYDYVPGHPLRLIRSAGDPKFSELRISDIDFSVFEYVNKTIDDKFVSEGFTVPEPELKVGDRVRLVAGPRDAMYIPALGKEGVITNVPGEKTQFGDRVFYRVTIEGAPMEGGWPMTRRELERAQ